jgi:hypothetical protein
VVFFFNDSYKLKCFFHFYVGDTVLYMTTTHQPGIKLTQDERQTKSRAHQFGLCEYCDAGLDKHSDFICHTPTNRGFKFMCNACHEYYNPGRRPDTVNFEF